MSISTESTDRTFAESAFCWAKDLRPERNQFVSFERRFHVTSIAPTELHLFADTRYRLFVNGAFVAYGPGRFVTAHPEYDTHAITARLHLGENVVRVEANYYGCSSFQTMPDGLPGFIAAGGVKNGDINFATPGDWLATIHSAWDSRAPYFSFAQNPAEICDTRILETELSMPAAHPVVALSGQDSPWEKPVRRSAPYPDYALVRPERIMATGPVADSLRWGIQLHRSDKQGKSKEYVSYVTWIHSPREQTVVLDCFWTDVKLNGERLVISYPARLGNHGESKIELREGWNFLAGNYEILLEQWSFLLGLPLGVGATLHARPDLACRETFALSGPRPQREIQELPSSPQNWVLPAGWRMVASDLEEVTPARIMAWDTPDKKHVTFDKPIEALNGLGTHVAKMAIWSFDFKDEYYGQPVVEVEAPAGSILDIAYDDWERADGCVNLYNSNPFTEAADRFKLKGGRQRIEVLNPRGGIYLQLVLRTSTGSAPASLTVHDVAIRRRTVFNKTEGSFTCGDPILDWAWQKGVHTLHASTDEAYSDCPWRERGSYIADCLVNLHLNRLIGSDLTVARRTFQNFGLAQLPNGLLSGCAPAWLRGPSEDFTLIWVLGVHDIWAHTGDIEFASKQWPVLQRIFESRAWKRGIDGLWDAADLFIDWGMIATEREGRGNSALNILRIASLRAAGELAAALGHQSECPRFADEAHSIGVALMDHVWNDSEGRFNASIGTATPALHANILALRFGVGHSDRILDYLEPMLKENFNTGISGVVAKGHAELYFFYYLLPALASHDRVQLAEAMIREHYGFIRELGYPTLPETFNRADHGSGSCCHSWSGAPAIYATEYLLGLRLATPGNPDSYTLAPVDSSHNHIEGVLPHRLGPIDVKWDRRGGRVVAKIAAPMGVTVIPAANVDIERL